MTKWIFYIHEDGSHWQRVEKPTDQCAVFVHGKPCTKELIDCNENGTRKKVKW